jgi:hypothetical protein
LSSASHTTPWPASALPADRRQLLPRPVLIPKQLLGIQYNQSAPAFNLKKKPLLINNNQQFNKGPLIQWTCILTLRAPDPPVS